MKKNKSLVKGILFIILFLFGSTDSIAEEAFLFEKPIVVVIPSYNNAKYYKKNLDSVFSQKYSNYRVVYIDDVSPDGTGQLVEDYIQEKGQQGKVMLIRNKNRVGAGANYNKGIWLCESHEIVACLDGDDWFAHEHVLEILNTTYSDPRVWVTYGQFAFHPCGTHGWAAELPKKVIANNAFRDYAWVTTHLRTFYAGLYHKIKTKDLLFNGKFYPMAQDLASMMPILEMSGAHSRFIPDTLYIYNIETPLNDMKIDEELQDNLGHHIRRLPRYQPINSPF